MKLVAKLTRAMRLTWVAEVNGTTEQLAAWGYSSVEVEAVVRVWTEELALATAIITQGSGVAQKISSLYHVPAERIFIVDNGVDPRLFSPRDQALARSALGIPPDAILLGYIGSYQVYHDLEVVVRALPELPEVGLYCVGSGSRRRSLIKLCQELGVADRVTFVDAAPYDRVPHYIAAFDLCLLTVPGKFLQEVRAFKIREYLCCGRPVLATAEGEFEDPLVRLCIIVKPDSPECIKDSVKAWLVNRDEHRLRALESSSQVAEEYSWLAASRRTADILRVMVP